MLPPLILLGQKAQRYDEALEKARKELQACGSTSCEAARQIFRLFPELKESESEKIKKEIIDIINSYDVAHLKAAGLPSRISEYVAWLEKQGSQDNDEDVDILYRFSFYSYKDEPNVIYLSGLYVNEEYRNKGIGSKILEVADEVSKSLDCHSIRLKTKKDSDAERLYQTHGYNSLVTEGKDDIWLEKLGEVAKEITKNKETAISFLKSCGIMNANGELADEYKIKENEQESADNIESSAFKDKLLELFQRFRWYCKDKTQTNGDIIEYVDAHIQELIDTIQKSAERSKEDIATISRVISIVKWATYSDHSHPILNDKGATELIERLKSIKDRYTWKPTEEQMKALEHFVRSVGESGYVSPYDNDTKLIYSLLEQLKQL